MLESDLSTFRGANRASPHPTSGSTPAATAIATATLCKEVIRAENLGLM